MHTPPSLICCKHHVCGTLKGAVSTGVVPIANNSAGPQMDIVGNEAEASCTSAAGRVGYLCSTLDEYARAITEVLSMDQVDRLQIAAAARRCCSVLQLL